MPTKVQLTPRQIALASGKNPSDVDDEVDDVQIEAAEDEASEDAVSDESNETEYFPDDDYEPEGEDWLDDKAKAYAASYGLTDQDLKSFGSMEDLERFGQLTDRRLATQYQEFQQKPPKETDSSKTPTGNTGPFELFDPQKLIDDNYDDTTVGLGKALRATQEALQKIMSNSGEAPDEFRDFDSSLDKMDESLFGTAFDAKGKRRQLSAAHAANRRAVFDAMDMVSRSVEAQQKESGQEMQIPQDILLQRAVSIAFGDVRSRPKNTAALQQQSRRRRPAGGRANGSMGAVIPRTTSDEDVAAIARSPKIRSFWEKAQRENGDL